MKRANATGHGHPLRKDLAKLVDAARAQGWTVTRTGRGHWRWKPPGDGPIIFCAGTPSDHHYLANTKARLKKAGFQE